VLAARRTCRSTVVTGTSLVLSSGIRASRAGWMSACRRLVTRGRGAAPVHVERVERVETFGRQLVPVG
jgi:hypothetical protein